MRDQVFLSCPEEFPYESRGTGYAHRERPSEKSAVDQFLQRLHCSAESVECVCKTEPCIQPEYPAVALYGLFDSLAFTDCPCHRFLAENILACAGGFHGHEPVPVRWSGYVHDVHIGIIDEVAVVVVGLERFPELLLPELDGSFKMFGIHVAEGYQTAVAVAYEMGCRLADASYSDYTSCKLVARCHISLVPVHRSEYVSRQYREKSHTCSSLFQKTSSAFVHTGKSPINLNYLIWIGMSCPAGERPTGS